jgi:hypothetical protein
MDGLSQGYLLHTYVYVQTTQTVMMVMTMSLSVCRTREANIRRQSRIMYSSFVLKARSTHADLFNQPIADLLPYVLSEQV